MLRGQLCASEAKVTPLQRRRMQSLPMKQATAPPHSAPSTAHTRIGVEPISVFFPGPPHQLTTVRVRAKLAPEVARRFLSFRFCGSERGDEVRFRTRMWNQRHETHRLAHVMVTM